MEILKVSMWVILFHKCAIFFQTKDGKRFDKSLVMSAQISLYYYLLCVLEILYDNNKMCPGFGEEKSIPSRKENMSEGTES